MSGEGATAAPAPARRWRTAFTLIGAVLLVLCGLLAWALATESGLRALVRLAGSATAGSVSISDVRGRLIGPMKIDELRFEAADLKLELRDLALDWQFVSLLTGQLVLDSVSVGELAVTTRATDGPAAPLVLPAHLRLPLVLRLHRLDIVSMTVRSLPAGEPLSSEAGSVFVVRDIALVLDSTRDRHQVHELVAIFPFGHLSLNGALDTAAPYALTLRGSLGGKIDPAQMPATSALAPEALNYLIELDVGGALAEPELSLRATGAGLSGVGRATATPFAAVPLKALDLALGELDPSLFVAGAPRAALRLEAKLVGSGADGLVLTGPFLIANSRPQTVDAGGLPLERVAGELSWSDKGVLVDGLDLRLPGKGRVGGSLGWEREPRTTAAAGGVPPQEAPAQEEPVLPPSGWLALPAAFGRLTLNLDLDGIDPARLDTRLPHQVLAGKIEADGDAARQRASIMLSAGTTRLEARGEMLAIESPEADPISSFSLNALLRQFDPRAYHPEAPQARLNLDLSAEGLLSAAPSVSAQFKIADSQLEGRRLSGSGQLKLLGERLSEVAVMFDLAGNQLRAEGDWGRVDDRLTLEVDAPTLAAVGYGLAGRAGLTGEISGGLSAPAGSLKFFGEALRLPGDVRIAGANGEARLATGIDGPFSLSVGLSGLGGLDTEDDWVESARLTAEGRRDDHRIELSVNGPAPEQLELALEGGLKTNGATGPRWEGRLLSLETAGQLVTRLQAPTGLSLGADEVRLAAAELSAGEQGRIRLLETLWTPTSSVLRGSLSGLAFGLLTRADGTARRGPGPLVLGAEWDVRLGETIDGEARLFREAGDLTVSGEIRTRLGLEHFESNLVARGNRLALSFAARGSELGEVSGSVTAEAERVPGGAWRLAPDAPLLGSARLAMPSIAWVGRLMRENVETGGKIEGSFSVAGTPADPLASGRITGNELQLALVDQGLTLSGGELEANFDRDYVRLSRLHFSSANRVRPLDNRVPFAALTATPGELTATGEIALDSGVGAFEFFADRLPLLQREDRWLILSGKGTGRSTWTTLDLDADLRADAGFFAIDDTPPPSLSDDVVVLGSETKASGGFGLSARLGIDLGDALYLSAMGVDTRLAGSLELRMAPGVPLYAVGSISTVGGTYLGYGQRLAIERGLINFQGELDNPGLNIVALRKGLEVEAGVAITGSARRPQVRLVSAPGVPDPEKLSWIVLGRAPDAGAGADLALLLPAAQALLGGPGGGMTEELSRSLGFDSFSIGQGDLTSSSRTATSRVVGSGSRISSGPTVAGQVLSMGKRISTDLVLSFEQSLGGAESLVKLTYQLGRRVSVVARGGTDNALDIYYTFSFR